MNTIKLSIKALALTLLAGLPLLAQDAAPKSVTPDNRLKEQWWATRHEQKLKAPEREGAQVVFIGDSITHGFEGGGKAVWEKYYKDRKALNLGYGGDRTEHVLWRLDNGEVDNLKPKLVVMMIGTNNTGHRKDKPEDIAAGIKAILAKLREKLPNTKVLLLGIFPRSANATDPMRVINDQANELIAKFADNKNVYYLNINKTFLTEKGELTKDIMPDLLHPNPKGYQLWAEATEPMIAKLLGDTPIVK